MGEFVNLIYAVKQDKDNFELIAKKMEPLINKYVRLLYKDNKEDMRSEFLLALWIAVCNISYYENEGQVVNFLRGALKNCYFELYKKSRKIHDGENGFEYITEDMICEHNTYENIIVKMDIDKVINSYQGIKRKIVGLIISEYSDNEIAEKLNLSRQYVNRVRRNLRKQCIDIIH